MNNSKWNDKRRTDAFKSTRKNNRSRKEQNIRPTNTRVWKNKTHNSSRDVKSEKSRNVIEPRKRIREPSERKSNIFGSINAKK